ncbi:hypothetical protein D3C81_1967790 [compost metagenome]
MFSMPKDSRLYRAGSVFTSSRSIMARSGFLEVRLMAEMVAVTPVNSGSIRGTNTTSFPPLPALAAASPPGFWV